MGIQSQQNGMTFFTSKLQDRHKYKFIELYLNSSPERSQRPVKRENNINCALTPFIQQGNLNSGITSLHNRSRNTTRDKPTFPFFIWFLIFFNFQALRALEIFWGQRQMVTQIVSFLVKGPAATALHCSSAFFY